MTETIKLHSLSRHFQRGQDNVQALNGIDLTIASGEFVALVGPSGSGKSTLLNLLGGLDRPSGGELWLDGVPLHSADETQRTNHRRDRIGFIFQSFNLLPRLTAVENVAVPLMLAGVPRSERQARASELLQQVGLGHRLHHYPTELSGGEQQRTAVARALIHQPSLILADEPTGNLDSKTGDEVMNLLQTLNRDQGITLIVVTHDNDVAAFADRIVRLRDGRIEEIVSNKPSQKATTAVATPKPASNGQTRLSFRDMVQTAVSNLGRRRVRNILTAAGVLIGIVTLVAMVSIGVGVQREVQRNFESIGLENIFVNPTYEQPDGFDPFAELAPVAPLTPQLVSQIRQLDGVVSVTPRLDLPRGSDISMFYNDVAYDVRLAAGFTERPPIMGDAEVALAGELLPEGDSSGVVLLQSLADTLLAEGETYADLIGRPLTLTAQLPRGEQGEFPTTIVGVRSGFENRALDVGTAERTAVTQWWFGDPDILQTQGYDLVIVRATNLGVVPAITTELETLDLEAQSFEGILDVANQVLSLLQAMLGSVGGLALLVAALGVANTMMMAIYERTREIGVLKALGASAREIRALFTVEAALIGLLGGFFGLIVGTLLGRLVDWIAHRYLIAEGVTGVGQISVVPPWLALGSLAFAALIGIVAGLYPAARAARLDPVAALRHE